MAATPHPHQTIRYLGIDLGTSGLQLLLLDKQHHVHASVDAFISLQRPHALLPAILWNDGRSGAQRAELEQRVPSSRQITDNLAMPGFTPQIALN